MLSRGFRSMVFSAILVAGAIVCSTPVSASVRHGDARAVSRSHSRTMAGAHAAKRQLVGYFGDWEGDVRSIPFSRLSMLIYGAADEANDSCLLPNGNRDRSADFPTLRKMKRHFHFRVLLAVGGSAYEAQFGKATSTHAKRAKLARRCVTRVRQFYPHLFDGIYLDWEGPANIRQQAHYSDLLNLLRTDLGPRRVLAAAITSGYHIQWSVARKDLNWFDLVSYSYHQPTGSKFTDFEAPLYSDPKDPQRKKVMSAMKDVTRLVRTDHVPAGKILLGIPYFGYAYAGVPNQRKGLYDRFRTSTGNGTLTPAVFQYSDILRYAQGHGYKRYGPNSYSGEYWLFHPGAGQKGIFISYDGLATVKAKAAFIKKERLGGAFVWTVAGDTSNAKSSLTLALHRYLKPIG